MKRLPVKFENPTFEGGKKGHQLYGANWQQHINQLLQQRYGNIKGIQDEQSNSNQQQQQQGAQQGSGQQSGQAKEMDLPKEKAIDAEHGEADLKGKVNEIDAKESGGEKVDAKEQMNEKTAEKGKASEQPAEKSSGQKAE